MTNTSGCGKITHLESELLRFAVKATKNMLTLWFPLWKVSRKRSLLYMIGEHVVYYNYSLGKLNNVIKL